VPPAIPFVLSLSVLFFLFLQISNRPLGRFLGLPAASYFDLPGGFRLMMTVGLNFFLRTSRSESSPFFFPLFAAPGLCVLWRRWQDPLPDFCSRSPSFLSLPLLHCGFFAFGSCGILSQVRRDLGEEFHSLSPRPPRADS